MASFLTKTQEEFYWACFCINSKPKLLEDSLCQSNTFHFLISLIRRNSISIEFYFISMIFSRFFCSGRSFCTSQYSCENFGAMEALCWETSQEYWGWAKLPSWIFWLTSQLTIYFYGWFMPTTALCPCSVCTKWWLFQAFMCTWFHS